MDCIHLGASFFSLTFSHLVTIFTTKSLAELDKRRKHAAPRWTITHSLPQIYIQVQMGSTTPKQPGSCMWYFNEQPESHMCHSHSWVAHMRVWLLYWVTHPNEQPLKWVAHMRLWLLHWVTHPNEQPLKWVAHMRLWLLIWVTHSNAEPHKWVAHLIL